MRKLICITSLLAILMSSVADGDVKSQIPFYILNAASTYDLDATLLYSICLVESRCNARAVNKDDGTPEEKAAGIKIKSFGLFQMKLATAENLGFVSKTKVVITKLRGKRVITKTHYIDNSKDLFNAGTNAFYAAKLIARLYKKYHSTEKVISAYNAGHYIKSNRDYVYKVLKNYAELKIHQDR